MRRSQYDYINSTGQPISEEWLEKIFESLESIFGEERFERAFPEHESFEQLQRDRSDWKNALFGCSYDEIKEALRKLKVAAKKYRKSFIPSHLEFYRICKNISVPYGYSTSLAEANEEKNLVEKEFERQKAVSREIRQKELKEMYQKNSIARIGKL